MPAWDLKEIDLEAGKEKVVPFSFKADSYIVYSRGTVPVPGIRVRPGTSIGTSALELIGDGSVSLPAKPGQEEYIALENKTEDVQHLFIIASQGVLPTIIGTTGAGALGNLHRLLDGDLHIDTSIGTVLEGDVVVGVDVAGTIFWQRLPRGTVGQVLVVQAGGSLAWVSPTGAAFQLIETIDLGAPTGAIDFQNIPDTFTHLELRLSLRSVRGGIHWDNLLMRFNNDSGANYDNVAPQFSHNALYTTGEGINANGFNTIISLPAQTSPSWGYATATVHIPDYTATNKHKGIHGESSVQNQAGTGTLYSRESAGVWKSIVAVSRITLTTVTGSNLDTNSLASLYGIMG